MTPAKTGTGWRDSMTPEQLVEYLNTLLKLDHGAISAILLSPRPCNKQLALHPTLTVGKVGSLPTVGLLGILNGAFGLDEDGVGPIVAEFEPSPLNNQRPRLKRFALATDAEFQPEREARAARRLETGSRRKRSVS